MYGSHRKVKKTLTAAVSDATAGTAITTSVSAVIGDVTCSVAEVGNNQAENADKGENCAIDSLHGDICLKSKRRKLYIFKTTKIIMIYLKPQNGRYYGKQCRPRWNAALSMFAMKKAIFRDWSKSSFGKSTFKANCITLNNGVTRMLRKLRTS